MPACGAEWNGAPPCFRGYAPGTSKRGWGQRLPTQALSPALWSTHETVQSCRRCRKVESALKPRRETFLLFGGSDTILLITVMTGCVLLGVAGVTQVLKCPLPV